ncbi:mechanosensitive ion channel family protein [Pseudovibrio sp. Tun.PSC04-5.I4]|uniref:mechanosensitive ion channel family protein n=1 Tax=Pseudovibrio sp. Tun.PSC04-5.I4 TaxID=1798213 RepID=UPI00088AD0D0|nr:mechanosensitive ion channel family protein [Pseudovibrio sp. Tun.PSC04-5.I4]SDR09356.1 MscS family membrane protein [Pseudovibrio sp. Tun.PSC04-5.I4]
MNELASKIIKPMPQLQSSINGSYVALDAITGPIKHPFLLCVYRSFFAVFCVLMFLTASPEAESQTLYKKYIKQQQKEILKPPTEKPDIAYDESNMPESLRMPAMPLMAFDAQDLISLFPLAPADTSSPRATLQSFLDIMTESNHLILDAYDENTGMGAFSMETLGMGKNHDRIQEKIHFAEILIERARGCFNLTGLPSATRKQTSLELALQLKEILDRIPLPPLDDIPGAPAGSYDFNQPGLEDNWTIPFTQITISRVLEGSNQGEYLFSQETVDRIPQFYEDVKVLPSRSPLNKDLYHFYASSAGQLLPPTWFSIIEEQPAWMLDLYYGQAVWQWIALLVVTAFVFMVLIVFVYRMRRATRSSNPVLRQFTSILISSSLVAALLFLRYLADIQINIGGQVLQVYDLTIETLVWIGSAVVIYKTIRLFSEIAFARNHTDTSIDRSIIRTATQFLAILCAMILLTYGATRLNIPLYGIIAGISVGGLAVALAAQPTFENLIGGLILYADGILRVGDFCEFNNIRGHVVTIGMRSTRIRTKDRTLVTIPNADLVKMNFKNFTLKDHFRVVQRFSLKHDTTAKQLQRVISKIKILLAEYPLTLPNTSKVLLEEIDDNGFSILIENGVKATQRDEYLEIQEDILIKVLELINEENVKVAHPFVTNYTENASSTLAKKGDGKKSKPKRS